MTTVPGFNLLIQQSGIVRGSNQSSGILNPDPGQVTAEQIVNEQAVKTKVQESEESERLKSKKEKDKEENQDRDKKRKKKESRDNDDPDSTGRLLDTIV